MRSRTCVTLASFLPVAACSSFLLLAACSSSPSSEPPLAPSVAPLRAVPDTYPATGFEAHPDYLPNNVLALTFDDGPDETVTAQVLDVLRDKGVKATFFINTENWSSVNSEPGMQAVVKRMVNEGHVLANHTVHHDHLPTLSAGQIEDEISGVEDTVGNIMSNAPRLSLLRAPYGEPYQDGMGYDLVAPIVANHAVHIGWNYDTLDYNCSVGDAACVLTSFKNGVKTPGHGAYGVLLMHSVWSQTALALPDAIDYARDKGFEFWTVEQVVCAKFGKGSGNVVDNTSGGCDSQPEMPDAGPGPGQPDAGPGPGQPDAGPGPGQPDAGPGPDQPDADTGNPDHPGPGNTTSGCGCRVGGSTGSAPGALLLLAPLALLVRRRRRRS